MCLPSWSYQESSSIAERVLEWGGENFSDFPWRSNPSPYEILVAELLLKRTTATAAVRVYEDFLNRFPSLQDIAAAPEEELVRALSSVGLQHQRARSMKRLAIWILSKRDGEIPSDLEDLLDVPGLGDYSATAILSFGYGVPVAVLDTNVERILVRVFRYTLPPRPTWATLRELAQFLLPREGHRAYNYGLLDLGRQICTYVDPRCGECPLTSECDFYNLLSGTRNQQIGEDTSAAYPSKLKTIRHDRGLSLKRLAEIANVSKLTVINIEAGRTFPRRRTLEKLAQALKVPPEKLSD